MTAPVTEVTPTPRLGKHFMTLAFAVHLVAWTAFVALWTASTRFESVGGIPVALGLWALAFIAGGAAIAVGRGLPDGLRGLFVTVTAVVFGVAGLFEVVGRVVVPAEDDLLWAVGGVFAYLGTLAVPLVLAGVVAAQGDRVGPVGNAWKPSAVVLLVAAVAAASVFALVVSPLGADVAWFDGWPLVATTGVGLVAAAVVVSAATGKGPAFGSAKVAGWGTISAGTVLLYLTCAQAVFVDATGIGGALLWFVAGPVFAIGAAGLVIAVASARRGTRAGDGTVADAP